jgi:hypothetical protein
MPSLQISFSPLEFGFCWHSKDCNCHNTTESGFYTMINNNSLYITESYDINREKIYTIVSHGNVIYTGRIDTKIFAVQLFKNLGIQ